MKKLSLFLVLIVVTFIGCKKDVAPGPTAQNPLPYSDDQILVSMVSTSPPQFARDLYFANETTGFISTYYGEIYKTIDGGKHWTLKYEPPTFEQPLVSILFVSDLVGFAVGGDAQCYDCEETGGIVLKTIDGGENWAIVLTDTNKTEFVDMEINSDGSLFLLGNIYNGDGTLLSSIQRSDDGGSSWTNIGEFSGRLSTLAFSGTKGFCGGEDDGAILLESFDNGATWNSELTFPYLRITDLASKGATQYFLVDYMSVYQASNGENWISSFTSFNHQSFKLVPLTESSCLVFGSGQWSGGDIGAAYGALRQTSDGGLNWRELQFSETDALYDASFYNEKEGYALGSKLVKVVVK